MSTETRQIHDSNRGTCAAIVVIDTRHLPCYCVFLMMHDHLWTSRGLALRRISCHGRNHSQASCEYSLTIFLCCQHHSKYSLLGSKFSTNLLFAASKCHVTKQQRGSSSVKNGRTGWDRCSGETLLAPCTRKKRLQRKMTKDYYWIGVQENIGMFSKS